MKQNIQRYVFELVTILYFFAKNVSVPLMQQYINTFVSQKYNFTEERDRRGGHCASKTKEHHDLREQIQEESSYLVLYLNIAELLPSMLVVLGMGVWSDMSKKRKFLIWLPCLGNALFALAFILPIYVKSLSATTFWYIGAILTGLSGNMPGFLSGNACYISDLDTPERRTMRLAIVELIIGLTFAFSNLAVGFWIKSTGYIQPFWFMCITSTIAFLLTLFCLKEPYDQKNEDDAIVEEYTGIKHTPSDMSGRIKQVVNKLAGIKDLCSCQNDSLRTLWSVFFAFQVFVFVQQGQERTFVLFLANKPLCWGPAQIGFFSFIFMTVSGLGTYPGILILHRCTGDFTILVLSLLSKAAGSVLFAFAKDYITAYLGGYIIHFTLIFLYTFSTRIF